MDEYKNIKHYMYYDDETKYVLGVFPNQYPELNDHPYELVNYKLAEPFYYNQKSFNGPHKLVKIKNKPAIIEEKPRNKILKKLSKYPIYQLNFEQNKKIDQNDFVIELLDNQTNVYSQLDLNTFPENGVNIFVTKKNNPFFLIKKQILPFNKSNQINVSIDLESNSLFVKNIYAQISLVKKYINYTIKPFLLINITELNQTILTANPQFFNHNKIDNIFIEIKEKYETVKIKVDNLLNSFYVILSKKQIKNIELCDEISASITDFSKYWLDELVKELSTTAVLYTKNLIYIFGDNDVNNEIYITPKQNPFKIIHKTSTKQIIKNTVDFDISAIMSQNTNKLKFLKCERLKNEN